MAMVGVASGSLRAAYRRTHSPGCLAWAAEPGELSKWLVMMTAP